MESRGRLPLYPQARMGQKGRNVVSAGITDYAQDMLKDIVYVELLKWAAGWQVGCVVESVKAVSDCYSPVDGVIVAVNEALLDQPELLNQDPYGDGWMVKIEVAADYENPDLMDAEAYRAFLQEEGH